MPPVLGWAAMTGQVGHEAWLLFLIIFIWTPPHFWALALYRVEDYRRSGLPMLPVTHGNAFTRLQVFLYTVVLFAACLLPFVVGMSGYFYLFAAVVLGLVLRLWLGIAAQLFGCAGTQNLPLFPDSPEPAVCSLAGGSLHCLTDHG